MSETPREQERIESLRARIWRETREITFSRISALEQSSTALVIGLLTAEQRIDAAGEAHKLAGSLGTFGFLEGFRLARAMERILKRKTKLNANDGKQLKQLLVQLRRELDHATEILREDSHF